VSSTVSNEMTLGSPQSILLLCGRPSGVTSRRWTTCSVWRRSTNAVKRSRLMRPIGSTNAFTLAGAMGRRGSRDMVARRSFPLLASAANSTTAQRQKSCGHVEARWDQWLSQRIQRSRPLFSVALAGCSWARRYTVADCRNVAEALLVWRVRAPRSRHEIVDVASSSSWLLLGFVSGRQWSHKQGQPGLSNGTVRDWPAASPPSWRCWPPEIGQ
jgi:hypothetical protein